MRLLIGTICSFLLASVAAAHPVPKDNHDRTIVVRLQKTDAPNRVRVRVDYRVEVDELTIYLNDMKEFKDEVNPLDYRGRALEYYAEFARIYAPIYAERLVTRLDKKPIMDFRWTKPRPKLVDDDGKSLGHLRCDFVFESEFELQPTGTTRFVFRELNYLLEPGQIVLSLVNETGLAIESKTVPDDALRKRALEHPEPGDDDRLREISVELMPHPGAEPTTPERVTPITRETHEHDYSLVRLILQKEYGLLLTLLLAFVFGAGHALTPGHGKTLVAAYLVGERGTLWHACFLGLVTTLTHTGVVIVIAIVLALLPLEMQVQFKSWLQKGLGLVMGLMVACMGVWLLLQRLAGRADHIHLDGGHHHHSSPNGAQEATRKVTWWGLVVLGVTGGLIPCWDAVALLLWSVGRSELWLVLPAILAFSAGLAVVLVLIGIFVVQAPRLIGPRWGNGRLVQALPIISAILVTLMGLWLCYEGVHGG